MLDLRPVQPLMIRGLKTPCLGPANPATCPVCRELDDHLAEAQRRRHTEQECHVVKVRLVHLRVAHPAQREGA
jgi:hypothetical protein